MAMRQTHAAKYAEKINHANVELQKNLEIIKRQDKLMVDLHQKNEVCQIEIAANEERVQD